MTLLDQKFSQLATDNAPGQEGRQAGIDLSGLLLGDRLLGAPVDFSHGDVDAFTPTPGSLEAFAGAVHSGGKRAYTEYRGDPEIRDDVAVKLARFTGTPISSAEGLIITPGTQGALFLALASTVSAGDKVAIVRPDYFANRKLVQFLGGEIVPVGLNYLGVQREAGLDLAGLKDAFQAGAKVFVFSNPNNPTGAVYSKEEIDAIAALAARYGATVVVDQLYARLKYSGVDYAHLCATDIDPANVITILGPSKTESLSGYRLGVAFGAPTIIGRMEKLQAIVSLRAAGYNQSALRTWFAEPYGWMTERIQLHEAIRNDLHSRFVSVEGICARLPQAGSYLFPRLPKLSITHQDFVRVLRHHASVSVTPGTEFSPLSSDSIRLNFSQEHSRALDAVDRIVELVERYRA